MERSLAHQKRPAKTLLLASRNHWLSIEHQLVTASMVFVTKDCAVMQAKSWIIWCWTSQTIRNSKEHWEKKRLDAGYKSYQSQRQAVGSRQRLYPNTLRHSADQKSRRLMMHHQHPGPEYYIAKKRLGADDKYKFQEDYGFSNHL